MKVTVNNISISPTGNLTVMRSGRIVQAIAPENKINAEVEITTELKLFDKVLDNKVKLHTSYLPDYLIKDLEDVFKKVEQYIQEDVSKMHIGIDIAKELSKQ